ncbi:agmatinase [Persicimonas caeni]|uniref:Agmatinase n=1 Tax=Persicimonas caeni TaxID=2292766 RepID=A0A4Y6PZ22_PERCE|nr:agmatinase [Persicimonas caeni]QDG53574.1 agmatinase [Persicimonas caeni]QED34795.1 agmatinase [Persicimonas caeni]
MSRLSFADECAPLLLGAVRAFEPGNTVIFGVGYDGTTSYRPGTRFGPDAIRRASDGLETYSPTQDADLEDLQITDAGNLAITFGSPEPVAAQVADTVEEILEKGGRPMMLGGEHSLTPGAVRGALRHHPDLVVVQLDAHADLRPDYLGERFSHACAMRRCLDVLGPGEDRLFQVGIRSGTREEWQELRGTERWVEPSADALRARLEHLGDLPVYLSVDLDVFDPAYMPGTGTPEPGGIDWACFESLLDVLAERRLVASDVVELAPELDPTGVSSVLAAKVVREILLAMGQ